MEASHVFDSNSISRYLSGVSIFKLQFCEKEVGASLCSHAAMITCAFVSGGSVAQNLKIIGTKCVRRLKVLARIAKPAIAPLPFTSLKFFQWAVHTHKKHI